MMQQQLLNQLKTGDLVFFSSKGLGSSLIRVGTFSPWSHVGMVLQLANYDFVTLWEAVPSRDGFCLYAQRASKGVQVVALEERVAQHQGDVAVRQLMGEELNQAALDNLMQLLEQLQGRRYEQDFWQLTRAGWDGPWGGNSQDLSSLFCSELVAAAYQRLGLLDETKPANEYTPADFSEDALRELNFGFYLSEEVELLKQEPSIGEFSFSV
ncbi:YiiX/YebB-like N1pC/P60 family cysteine hydrolase [Agarivorans sp. QJM3NY_29]|uniref:YiiX/YebB-like N1pC/P60 family cysteine hydrolase n=1 Tax=unclassified Agarivorans TaxID=2636026 RepID=UPI003D7C80D7